jgi:very-short-patch-repair endonuclease
MAAARLDEIPLDTGRPFTRADAVKAGVDPKILRTSLFRRIFRGVYISAKVPDSPFVRTQAALVLHPPAAYASHTSAARVYGLPVPVDPLEHVSVQSDKDRRSRRGVRSHVWRRPRVVSFRGIRVSHLLQLFVELASMLSLVELVVVGDAMAKRFRLRPEDLVEACERCPDRFASDALTAARYVRAEVDSPMESRLRMLIVLAGLPEPEVNFKIRDEFGNVLRRLDLSYPWLKLIVEYDGRQHVERMQQWDSDIDRREEFDDDGWKTLIVTAKGVYKEPERTIARVHKKLVQRGCRGLPRRLSDDWRAHFPGQN